MRNVKYLISGLLLSSVCMMSCGKPSKQDLIDNYESKQKEIDQLYAYVNDITPKGKFFEIEFENDNKIFKFSVSKQVRDSLTGISGIVSIPANGDYNEGYMSNWNLDIASPYVDNLLNELGWTRKELNALKQKLDNANCISVDGGSDRDVNKYPMTIGYKRVGLGIYFYKIFNQTLSDSLINKYNDGCTYIFYKDNIVLEYRGGVIGSQCF